MAVNKVDYFGENLIDLTNDTVTESTLLSGATAHDKSGNLITGNVTTAEVIPTKAEVESNATPGKVADALVTKEVLEAIKVLQNAGYLTEETDPTVPAWAKEATKPTYTASEVGALPNDTTIPSALSDMSEDTTHRVVTDAEKQAWNGKSDFSGSYNDLTDKPTIPSVATSTVAGTVKPDGTTTIIDEDGTIHATGGGGTSVDILATKEEVEANTEVGKVADALVVKDLSTEVSALNSSYQQFTELLDHNIPRIVSKDITTYYQDGTLWDRIAGRNGYKEFEDIYAGDYFQMSRPISAYERTNTYQETGSDYVTIAGINTLMWNGDDANVVNYNHLVMVPGKGRDGLFHFGRSRMNSSHTTSGGYYNSEMNKTTIGAVVSAGSTASTATINQQLYAEFGVHLATTRELLSDSTTSSASAAGAGYTGTSNSWAWHDCQAVLMSEIEVYGANVFSSSGFDTGNACVQLPIFRDKRFLNNRSAYYWLKNVATSTDFCGVGTNGLASYGGAGNAYPCVRPRFVIRA